MTGLRKITRARWVWVLLILVATANQAGADCTLTTGVIVFGNYNPLVTLPLDTTGSLAFRCGNRDHNVEISFDKGGAPSFSQRRLLKGNEPLLYNLFLDASLTSIWGDGTGGTQTFLIRNPQPNNTNIIIPIFGRIPAGQQVSSGAYTNTLVMTINY